MNSAKAAAAASTPNIKGGVYLDSFDARIIEYQYAIWKLQLLITHIKALSIKIRSSTTLIPLIHYIETIIGPLLSINDTLSKRLESITRLIPITDQRKVIPPVNTFPINFELDDTVAPKTDYKGAHDYRTLLEQLLNILENALLIYQKKLSQSLVEREANRIPDGHGVPPPLDLNVFREILQAPEILSLFKYVIEKDQLEASTWIKAQAFGEAIERSTLELKTYIAKLREYKSKPVDGSLKKLKDWQYTIHKIFALVVRLSDLYSILRKFGRELYIPAYDELHNPKVLHNNIKLEVALKSYDEIFKTNKKNQQLVFILVKSTHQGSYFHLKHPNVLEFANCCLQGYEVVSKTVEVLLNLIRTWEIVKKERPIKQIIVKSPTDAKTKEVKNQEGKKLEVLFNPEKDKSSQEAIAKQQRERERLALVEREAKEKQLKERQFIDDLNTRRKVEERERQLRDGLRDSPTSLSRNGSLRNSNPVQTRSRSNSNASVTSSSSNSSALNSLRTSSLTNGKPKSSPTVSRSPSLQRRPVSVYLSSPAFDIRSELRRQEKARLAAASGSPVAGSPPNTPPPQVLNRRRSSSLQSQTSSAERNNSYIAAAASAALKQERHSSLKSKNEVIQYRHSIQKREQQLLGVPSDDRVRSRSPSPLRSKSQQPINELPNIHELTLNDIPEGKTDESQSTGSPQSPSPPKSILKPSKSILNNSNRASPVSSTNKNTRLNQNIASETPARRASSSLPNQVNTINSEGTPAKQNEIVAPVPIAPTDLLPSIEPSSPITLEAEPETEASPESDSETLLDINCALPTIPVPVSTSTSDRPVLKIIPPTSTLDPPAITPELINETTSESSASITDDQLQLDTAIHEHSPKSLETLEPELPKPLIKKVRFTGVPDYIEEDHKPKKKGWIKPPRLMANAFGNNSANKTSLSFAADALQQERIAFHNIRKGEVVDANTASNQRLTGALGANNGNKGKWKSFRDRFS